MMAFRAMNQFKHKILIKYNQRSILRFFEGTVCSSAYDCDLQIPGKM